MTFAKPITRSFSVACSFRVMLNIFDGYGEFPNCALIQINLAHALQGKFQVPGSLARMTA
jgi:hypothetical protein